MNNGLHCESPGAALEMLVLMYGTSLKDLKNSHYIAHSPNLRMRPWRFCAQLLLRMTRQRLAFSAGSFVIKGGAPTFFSTAKA